MGTIAESDIVAVFSGREINAENLAKCGQRNRVTATSTEYIVYSCGFLYNRELREWFGVTDKQKDLWERKGTEFNIYLYIAGNTLTDARIFKYTESGGARPSVSTPKCTQQELRIAHRILEYVTV